MHHSVAWKLTCHSVIVAALAAGTALAAHATVTSTDFLANGQAQAVSIIPPDTQSFSGSGTPVSGAAIAGAGTSGLAAGNVEAASAFNSEGEIDFQAGAFTTGRQSQAAAASGFVRTFRYDSTAPGSGGGALVLQSVIYGGSMGFFIADFNAPGCRPDNLLACRASAPAPDFGSGDAQVGLRIDVAYRDPVDGPGAAYVPAASFEVRLNLDGSITYGDNTEAAARLNDFGITSPTGGVNGLAWDSTAQDFVIGTVARGAEREVSFTVSTFADNGSFGPENLLSYSCIGDPLGGGLAGGGGGVFRSPASALSGFRFLTQSAPPISSAALCRVGAFVPAADVPAPSALLLMGLGLLALGVRSRGHHLAGA